MGEGGVDKPTWPISSECMILTMDNQMPVECQLNATLQLENP